MILTNFFLLGYKKSFIEIYKIYKKFVKYQIKEIYDIRTLQSY